MKYLPRVNAVQLRYVPSSAIQFPPEQETAHEPPPRRPVEQPPKREVVRDSCYIPGKYLKIQQYDKPTLQQQTPYHFRNQQTYSARNEIESCEAASVAQTFYTTPPYAYSKRAGERLLLADNLTSSIASSALEGKQFSALLKSKEYFSCKSVQKSNQTPPAYNWCRQSERQDLPLTKVGEGRQVLQAETRRPRFYLHEPKCESQADTKRPVYCNTPESKSASSYCKEQRKYYPKEPVVHDRVSTAERGGASFLEQERKTLEMLKDKLSKIKKCGEAEPRRREIKVHYSKEQGKGVTQQVEQLSCDLERIRQQLRKSIELEVGVNLLQGRKK